MYPILQVGPLAIPLAPFSILLMFWLGLSLAEKFSPKRGISADSLYNMVMVAIISGLITGRIGYVFQHPQAFIQAPISLVSLNPGLLDPFSAFAAALISVFIYGARKKLQIWNTLDALTPLLAMIAVGIALAHIASGEAFGSETNASWGIDLWGAVRHPTQFYELIAALAILFILGWLSKKNMGVGFLFLSFAGFHAGVRLFLEAFRGESSLTWGGFRTAQILAWIILALVIIGVEWQKKSQKNIEKDTRHG